jgi:hypothetical protein
VRWEGERERQGAAGGWGACGQPHSQAVPPGVRPSFTLQYPNSIPIISSSSFPPLFEFGVAPLAPVPEAGGGGGVAGQGTQGRHHVDASLPPLKAHEALGEGRGAVQQGHTLQNVAS